MEDPDKREIWLSTFRLRITTKTQAVALVAGKSGGRVAVADIEAGHARFVNADCRTSGRQAGTLLVAGNPEGAFEIWLSTFRLR